MDSSHWWQRWSTPIRSENPFKPDLEALSPFFVRSEVGDSTLPATETPRASTSKSPEVGDSTLPATETPRASTANPFRRNDADLLTLAKSPEVGDSTLLLATETPRASIANPFRRNDDDLITLAKSPGLPVVRQTRKPVKLPEDFDGKQPLKEYLMHFERCSIVNGWTEEEKAMFLAASLRGDSRKLLSGLTDSDCQQYDKIVARLQLRFGVEKQAELHQARLLNRRQFEGESLQVLATDIRSMVDLAYQDLGAPVQERFAVQHFIDALSDKDDRLYLRREKPGTLDQALSLARELESLRLLDSNNSSRPAGSKVRAMETEQTQLQTKVDGLRLQIDQQQQQLEAQQNILTQLNEFLVTQLQPQGTPTIRNDVPQGNQTRGWECWHCGKRGHMRKECPQRRGRPASDQYSENGNRVSSRAQ